MSRNIKGTSSGFGSTRSRFTREELAADGVVLPPEAPRRPSVKTGDRLMWFILDASSSVRNSQRSPVVLTRFREVLMALTCQHFTGHLIISTLYIPTFLFFFDRPLKKIWTGTVEEALARIQEIDDLYHENATGGSPITEAIAYAMAQSEQEASDLTRRLERSILGTDIVIITDGFTNNYYQRFREIQRHLRRRPDLKLYPIGVYGPEDVGKKGTWERPDSSELIRTFTLYAGLRKEDIFPYGVPPQWR